MGLAISLSLCISTATTSPLLWSYWLGVRLSEGRGQNNQQPTPNDNKSKWWSSSAVLVYDLHRGMCCKPSGKVQEGREGLLMGNICDW